MLAGKDKFLLQCNINSVRKPRNRGGSSGHNNNVGFIMWNDFKNFAFKGNAFDLAVGVIIGAAFGKIVDSLVNDIIMPIIGAITGGISFVNLFTPLHAGGTATDYASAVKEGATLGWGNFLTIIINFAIIAFVLFLLVNAAKKLRQEPAPKAAPAPTPTEKLLAEIRDTLQAQKASAPAATTAAKKR
jgi:large conductance mechanosensitive channel